MIIIHRGLQYLHIAGWLYIDRTTRVPFADWLSAGKDPFALTWQHCPAGWSK